MEYRRTKIEGGTYFFTLITYNRRNFLCNEKSIILLKKAFERVKNKYPFSIDAITILPDHFHCIITLPREDMDYPMRIRLIKTYFTNRCYEVDAVRDFSRARKNEKTIWQRRYWEHFIRDDEDMTKHTDYIHYNPVKHGLVQAPKDWKYSSFHRFVREGIYDRDWGYGANLAFEDDIGGE